MSWATRISECRRMHLQLRTELLLAGVLGYHFREVASSWGQDTSVDMLNAFQLQAQMRKRVEIKPEDVEAARLSARMQPHSLQRADCS